MASKRVVVRVVVPDPYKRKAESWVPTKQRIEIDLEMIEREHVSSVEQVNMVFGIVKFSRAEAQRIGGVQ